ncbi:MAG: 4'-phosphopantetheinyl transferase family protein [Aeoliella sp.]
MNGLSLENVTHFDLEIQLDAPRIGELHLWKWRTDNALPNIESPKIESLNIEALSVDERGRYDRFVDDEVRSKFLVAHVGLRRLLGNYLGCEPGVVELENSLTGKPRMAGGSLRFNMSHSGELVVVAVSCDEVGIDVERVRTVASLPALAARYMTSNEQAAIDEASEDERLATFFQLWTRKEAAVKLTGLGLQAAVGLLDVSPVADLAGELSLPADWSTDLESCWLANIAMPAGYVGAVAVARSSEEVTCRSC